MGRMLDALKQIEDQAPSAGPARPVVAERHDLVEPSVVAEPAAAPMLPEPLAPIDPRYREVLGAVLSQLTAHDRPVVLIAGFADDEPRGGQLAAFYSALIGRVDGDVLLVDADLGRAGLTEQLDLRGEQGLADVLARRADWRDLIRSTGHPGLTLLPGIASAERFSASDVSPLLTEWREAYQLVVVDALLPTPREIADWSIVCDAVLLAVRLGVTPRHDAQKTLRAIQTRGGNVLGCVLIEP